jgi:glycosyltransferase involved in cell wall biosynthesis
MASTGRRGRRRRVLIIVENLPVPFDRRVWQEATTLRDAAYDVSIICPTGRGYEAKRETVDGIAIFRHSLPIEASGALAYLIEYVSALFWQTVLVWRILVTRGFDVIHACNPPDTIFIVAAFFKLLFRKKFVFDHHDLCPELYLVKFRRRDLVHAVLQLMERCTFALADVSIATNQSYRRIAIERGAMDPQKVFVVRSGPQLERMQVRPPKPALKHGRRYLVGYVGVMGKQEGIDYLLEAIRHIRTELARDDIHFTLVGSGPELPALKVAAERLGVAACVTFTGRLSDVDLLDVLNTADVCVNPDEVNEMNDMSTMNKIMEYMALGKPIVQFETTEGRFSAQEASLYAKPNDSIDFAKKLVELVDDPARRERMGLFGQQRVLHELAWDYEAPNLLAAYDSLWSTRPETEFAKGPKSHGLPG